MRIQSMFVMLVLAASLLGCTYEDDEQVMSDENAVLEKVAYEAANQEEQEDINAIVGYWLNTEENIAAHVTKHYIATAKPYSDFITNDEISTVKPISPTRFNVTFADGNETTFTLGDDKTTLITHGLTYKRVSKEEANAIFDGHYELP